MCSAKIKCVASITTVMKAMSQTTLSKINVPASQRPLMCKAAHDRTAGHTEDAAQPSHTSNAPRLP